VQAKITAGSATVAIDLVAIAVIIVDMRNDFVSEGGMLDRLGVDIRTIRRAVGLPSVIAAGRQLGMKIIYLKMPSNQISLTLGLRIRQNWIVHQHAGVRTRMRAPDGRGGRILIRETLDKAVVDELEPERVDIQI
jgi:ureidoacrylate peracid hydrolase